MGAARKQQEGGLGVRRLLREIPQMSIYGGKRTTVEGVPEMREAVQGIRAAFEGEVCCGAAGTEAPALGRSGYSGGAAREVFGSDERVQEPINCIGHRLGGDHLLLHVYPLRLRGRGLQDLSTGVPPVAPIVGMSNSNNTSSSNTSDPSATTATTTPTAGKLEKPTAHAPTP